jgi:hypothetical protein
LFELGRVRLTLRNPILAAVHNMFEMSLEGQDVMTDDLRLILFGLVSFFFA